MSGFASTKDLADKQVSFDELGPGLYAYTAEGDPNSGVIVGPDGVVVVDAQATPAMAGEVQKRIAEVTDAEAVSWIGSALGTAKQYRWQVRLRRGEQLNVIGEQTVSRERSSCKITSTIRAMALPMP